MTGDIRQLAESVEDLGSLEQEVVESKSESVKAFDYYCDFGL